MFVGVRDGVDSRESETETEGETDAVGVREGVDLIDEVIELLRINEAETVPDGLRDGETRTVAVDVALCLGVGVEEFETCLR
jgi:hypothetical protein